MKTAVEWLIDEYFEGIDNCTSDFRYYIKKAKEMEKEKLHNIREMLMEGALTNMSCSSAIIEFDKLTFKSE